MLYTDFFFQVVATIAFGLGIDKGDVRYHITFSTRYDVEGFTRYIIHYDMSKSFEGAATLLLVNALLNERY
jgi:superfamily II DNA helicase RecQ